MVLSWRILKLQEDCEMFPQQKFSYICFVQTVQMDSEAGDDHALTTGQMGNGESLGLRTTYPGTSKGHATKARDLSSGTLV